MALCRDSAAGVAVLLLFSPCNACLATVTLSQLQHRCERGHIMGHEPCSRGLWGKKDAGRPCICRWGGEDLGNRSACAAFALTARIGAMAGLWTPVPSTSRTDEGCPHLCVVCDGVCLTIWGKENKR